MQIDRDITKLRPKKQRPDPTRPYLFLHEREPEENGQLHPVNTIFLSNRECSFKCLMCDLWKNTLDKPTPTGAIPEQIRFALDRLPPATHIKLYNNGNFFDQKAIPYSDHPAIAKLLTEADHLIVENHPALCNDEVPAFAKRLNATLEIAMGLESIHPDVLPRLRKKMTPELFRKAVRYLSEHGIRSRAFILLNPPFLTDPEQNREWCLKSVEYAFDAGVAACSIIPVRAGNGIMDRLHKSGDYVRPTLGAIEEVLDSTISYDRGRVFADLWDLEKFSSCDRCFQQRKYRLYRMNLEQKVLPRIPCSCESGSEG